MRPWAGGGRASERSTDAVVSAVAAARGLPPPSRSFQILDLPHLGTLTNIGVKCEKRAIGDMRDVELDAWLEDRSLEPLRAGLSRAEREAMAYRVRKLPCDDYDDDDDDDDDYDDDDGDDDDHDDDDYENPSPRTVAQGKKGPPQKMPRKTVKQRTKKAAMKSTFNDTMTSVSTTSTKRALKDVNGTNEDAVDAGAAFISKKPKVTTAAGARAQDVQTIEAIIGDIKDPTIKAALESIVKAPTKGTAGTPTISLKKRDEATLDKLTDGTVRTIQKLINEKLKWKGSYKHLKGGDTKGGRVEVICNEPEVFERIFEGAVIKKGKDGKLSCSLKSEEDINKCNIKFKGKSYRYNSSYLCAPYTASLKDNSLTFSFKFSIW